MPRILFGGPAVVWNQRLTLVVDTPQGQVSASSVSEVRKIDRDGILIFPQASGVNTKVIGEAVVLEVLPDRWVFAIVGGFSRLVFDAFELRVRGSYDASIAKLRKLPRNVPAPVPFDALPWLVTFEDIDDPTTARRVLPEDMEDVFGPGVRLAEATVQITRDPVTSGEVEKLLPTSFFVEWGKKGPLWNLRRTIAILPTAVRLSL